MSSKVLAAALGLGAIIIAGIAGAYFFMMKTRLGTQATVSTQGEQNEVAPLSQPIKKSEPKTETLASQRVADYWENTRFGDFGPNYDLMCDDVKQAVSKDVFVQKYKEDREENPLRKPEKVEVGNVRIEGDTAIARVTIFTLFYTEGSPGTTELKYENGKWCLMRKPETLKWLQE